MDNNAGMNGLVEKCTQQVCLVKQINSESIVQPSLLNLRPPGRENTSVNLFRSSPLLFYFSLFGMIHPSVNEAKHREPDFITYYFTFSPGISTSY